VSIMKLFSIAAKAKVVTRRYPFEPPVITEEFRGKIKVDPKLCWGCGVCTRICPPNALTLKEEEDGTLVLSYFMGRCIFCGMCAEVCPREAITVTKEFELASLTAEDLVRDVKHEVIRCRICGRVIGPAVEMKEATKSVGGEKVKYYDLCPECRKLMVARGIITRLGVRP